MPVERAGRDRIGRLKSMARKLLAEVERIEETGASNRLVSVDFYEEVKRVEADLIVQALTYSAGHQVRAAQLLNIKASTLNAKIKQYGIETNTFSRTEHADISQPFSPKLRVLK